VGTRRIGNGYLHNRAHKLYESIPYLSLGVGDNIAGAGYFLPRILSISFSRMLTALR
jgi:hypothetical protein